jgi:hypothetical protein
MQTFIESIVQGASAMAMGFAVLGALIAYAVAAHLELREGFRLAIAVAGFVALFAVGAGYTPRLTGDSTSADETAETAPPPLWKYAGVATDTTGAALATFFEDALRELQAEPVRCVNFLYGVLHSRVPPQLSRRLENRFEKLTARVVEEGRRSAQPRVDSLSAVALRRLMVARLRESHGEGRAREILTVMSDPANGLSRPRAVCEAATAMYSTIADMPPSEGGTLMRYMIDRQVVAPARGAVWEVRAAVRADGAGPANN